MAAPSPGHAHHGPCRVNTTVFISNLHCPSCVTSIQEALQTLDPAPDSISHSIVSHSVTLCHDPGLPVQHISDSLELAGFEVHSIFRDSHPVHAPDSSPDELDDNDAEWEKSLEQAVRRWSQWRNSSKVPDMTKRQRHIQQCAQCAAECDPSKKHAAGSAHELDALRLVDSEKGFSVEKHSIDSGLSGRFSLDSVVSTAPESAQLYHASIAITGMTCSACVGSITRVVEELPYVRSIAVSLLTHSASVELEAKDNVDGVIGAIEDAGFDAGLDSIEEIPDRRKSVRPPAIDKWKAVISIGGMTCSACTNAVTAGVQQLPWVESVNVNLLSHSATVIFSGKENTDAVKEAIEDCGFDATLDNVSELVQEKQQDVRRTVMIRIDGMFCHHCPSNVIDILSREYMGAVQVEAVPTIKEPILQIRYTPNLGQNFTIRHILKTISDVNPALEPSIHHPPTIEERARHLHARERKRILLRLGLCVAVAIPTFIIGIVFMSLVSSKNPARMFLMEPMWSGGVSRTQWALFILATPVYFFAADTFHKRAIKEVRALWRRGSRTPVLQRFYRFGSMNMLMSLGTSIAYFASIAELGLSATGTEHVDEENYYFDSVVFLTMFLLLGRFLEAYSKTKTGDAVTALGNLRPTEAILVDTVQMKDQKVSVDLLEVGDVIRVQHGSTPAFDGTIMDASAKFDESSLTGEARLVSKEVGDTVFAGTANKGSPIQVKLTSISGSSMLDQIIKVVREGQTRRAPVERVADMITSHFVPVVVSIAIMTWVIWLSLGLSGALPQDYRGNHSGSWELWSLRFAIALFVVACPCGIGLASPTALFVGGGLAARYGILVKGGGEAFQEASALDCIVFDKTGTLTQGGDPAVTDAELLSPLQEDEVCGLAKRLEESSSHPIATAISTFCGSKKMREYQVIDIQEIPGKGLKGTFKTADPEPRIVGAIIGNESLLVDHNVHVPVATLGVLDGWKRQGKSVALMATSVSPVDGPWTLTADFAIADALRPEARDTVAALQAGGIDVWMLSGDNPTTAVAVGAQVGIPSSNVIAGVLPDQKAEKIQYLQRTLGSKKKKKKNTGRATVAMVGDGINDSPALTMADVGIAIGSGSDVAISSADFILMTSSLESVLTLVQLSRKVFRRVWFNFMWAGVYNLCAMPIAAGVLYPLTTASGSHIRLDPVWASLAMAMSSVSVVCSSLMLRSKIPGVGFRPKT
ncbi:copper resistance-associated p-type atpase [Diplodia corticola]|uniref:Copper resistance-associated P-type atpase n=1 Tax=Diplodia corticola TaxID=236234 RepID=A0A1J9QRB0_9PEZI|nr:copper resistance-associated p-type atpase [Diplodia corticola]OJD30953.1 copper resistance-associated p-type atpase [Diplodia corticola]